MGFSGAPGTLGAHGEGAAPHGRLGAPPRTGCDAGSSPPLQLRVGHPVVSLCGEQHWPGQQRPRCGHPSPSPAPVSGWPPSGPDLVSGPRASLCSSLISWGLSCSSQTHSHFTNCTSLSCSCADRVRERATGDVRHGELYWAAFKQGFKVNAYKT